jgi:hypothetical protein
MAKQSFQVLNMDKNGRQLMNHNLDAVADVGTDSAPVIVEADPRAAIIDAADDRLPISMIAEGRMTLSHETHRLSLISDQAG